jgi:hypothetical protein
MKSLESIAATGTCCQGIHAHQDHGTERDLRFGERRKSMEDTAWLRERGFGHVGSCIGSEVKLRRLERLERAPGVYAFVVENKVRYVGKATRLRSRRRGYDRSLKPETKRRFRKLHKLIARAVTQGAAVDVWIWRHTGEAMIEKREAQWIREKAT